MQTEITLPEISIVLPVYNAELYLRETIDSILNQSFKDYELIIINDGSSDQSESIILSYNDYRIRYIRNEENIKLIRTLNKGIELARAKYILRMDADDIMLPERLSLQYSYMEVNQDVVASGGSMILFGVREGRFVTPETSQQIKKQLFFGTPIFHPTAIIRRDILIKYAVRYKLEYIHAEDYKLWCDLSKIGKLTNIKKDLLKYRITSGQISSKYRAEQLYMRNIIRKELINDFLEKYHLSGLSFPVSVADIKQMCKWLRTLKFQEQDRDLMLIIIHICFMSFPAYNISRLWLFLKSFLWLNGLSCKQSIIIIASTVLKKRWKIYSVY